jgi:hypothetical protein
VRDTVVHALHSSFFHQFAYEWRVSVNRRIPMQGKQAKRRLLDSRVVDVPMASNPIFVLLSSLKPFLFN